MFPFPRPRLNDFIAAVACLSPSAAWAEDGSSSERGSYGFFRWADDFDYLDDQTDREGIEHIKHIEVLNDPELRLSFGGDYRLRIESFRSPDYGLTGLADYSSVQNRFHLHSDVEVGDGVRIFGQLGYFTEDGREPRSRSTDFGGLDFHQLFIDVGLSGDLDRGFVRFGRQELNLGANIFFGSREGANVRQVFDAAKLESTYGEVKVQAFIGRPVLSEPNAFDDRVDRDELTWGLYSTYAPMAWSSRLDLYYLGRSNKTQVFAQGVADETRHTFGARYYGDLGAFEFDVEGAYQFGSFGDGDISAWAIATDIRYGFDTVPGSPHVGLRANIASGDQDPDDPDLQSFNALYPNLAYFSDDATFAPINAFDWQPYVNVQATEQLQLQFSADAIFRLNGGDAFYGPGQRVLVPFSGPGGGSGGERATLLLQAKASWNINRHATGTLSVVRGAAGSLVDDAGGESFTYVQVQLSTRF